MKQTTEYVSYYQYLRHLRSRKNITIFPEQTSSTPSTFPVKTSSTPSTSTTYTTTTFTTTTTSFSSSTATILTTTTFNDQYYTGYLVSVLDFFLNSNRRALKPAGFAVVVGFGLALAIACVGGIVACFFYYRRRQLDEETYHDDGYYGDEEYDDEQDQAEVEAQSAPEAKEISDDDNLHEKEMQKSKHVYILPGSTTDLRARSASGGSMVATLEEDSESVRSRHSRSSSVDSVKQPPRPFPNMFD